ncbi:MAG: transcriptional regulator [Caldilineae bacterium]|nr:MAG: transcriptional regulator [Caldilineae bacterium]
MSRDENNDLSKEVTQLHATLCQTLSDPTRICILYALRGRAIKVSDLASELDAAQSTISRHLKILRERRLVIANRHGTSIYYQLADERVLEALDILRAVLADILKNQVELARVV